MYTCQNEAVTKLIVCLGKQYNKSFMWQSWVKLYFYFTERGNYKEKLDLTQSIELVIFLLEKMPPLVDVSRKPSITSQKALKIQQHAKLLTTTFSCCKYFSTYALQYNMIRSPLQSEVLIQLRYHKQVTPEGHPFSTSWLETYVSRS